jgi:hypothetical protein
MLIRNVLQHLSEHRKSLIKVNQAFTCLKMSEAVETILKHQMNGFSRDLMDKSSSLNIKSAAPLVILVEDVSMAQHPNGLYEFIKEILESGNFFNFYEGGIVDCKVCFTFIQKVQFVA